MADESLSQTYAASRQSADQAELYRWANEQLAKPDIYGPPSPQPGQAGKAAEEKLRPVPAIEKVIQDTFTQGATHFIAGLQNRPKGITDWAGAGQQLLGIMQMASALPAGMGEAFKQALMAYSPGMENEVAIKGGKAGEWSAAGVLRSAFGAPIAMYLDPKLWAEIKKNPQPFAEALNTDLTYGEVMDLVGQLVGYPLGLKAGKRVLRMGRGGPGEPPGPPGPPSPPAEVPPTAPTGPIAPTAPTVAPSPVPAGPPRPPKTTADIMRELGGGRLPGPPGPPEIAPGGPKTLADLLRAAQLEGPDGPPRVLAEQLKQSLEEGPPTFTEALRDRYPAAAEAEGPVLGPPSTPEGPLPTAGERGMARAAELTTLRSAVELALTRSERVIAETVAAPAARAAARKAKAAEPAAPAPEAAAAPAPAAAVPEAPAVPAPAAAEAPIMVGKRQVVFDRPVDEAMYLLGKKGYQAIFRDVEGAKLTPAEQRAMDLITRVMGADKREIDAWAVNIMQDIERTVKNAGKGREPIRIPPISTVETMARRLGFGKQLEAEVAGKAAPEPVAAAGADNPFARMAPDEVDAVMGTLDLMHTALKDAAPGQRHLVTDDVGKVTGGLAEPSTYPDFMEAVIGKKTRGNADKLMEVIDDIQAGKADTPVHKAMIDYARAHWDEWSGQFGGFGGEGGAVSPALLARMALGAAAGGTQGDTPEEKMLYAFLGMGLGAAASRSMARKIMQAYKESGLADESGALDFSKWSKKRAAVQASEQEFQPNYARIEATPDVKNTMKQVHRLMKEDILEKRGPARSNELRVQEASELIASDKVTPERLLTIGEREVWNDSELTAARMLHVRAFHYATELRDQVMTGAAVPEGSFKQSVALAGALGRNLLALRKRTGQAEQSWGIKVRGEEVGFRPQDSLELADIAPGKTDKQLATIMSGLKPAEVERFSLWMHLFPKMILQGVYFSYLSGKAAARNTVGNATMIGIAPIERGIGRFMPLWGSEKPGILPGEATQMARAMADGITDQVRMRGKLDLMEAAARREGVDLSNLKTDRRQPAGREFVEELTDNQRLQRLGDYYDNVTTFPGHVLEQTDVASKTINARMQHAVEAQRQATFEGHTGDAWEARVTQLKEDITELSQTSRQRITEFADRQTFTQEFESKFLQYLARGPDSEWGNFLYRGFIMPFFRVTARMTEATMARTPGLNLLTKQFWNDWNAGGAQRQMAQARVVSGAATAGAFMYLESQGVLTGNAPKDPEMRKLWQDAGYRERSFWNFATGQWTSYDGLGPLTTIVAGAADTSLAARKMPEKSAASLFMAYLMSNINSLDSRTFTQSISNFLDVVKTKNSEGQVEKSMEFLRRQMAGWVKPGVVRELETLGDPEIRRGLRSGAYEEGSLTQEWHALLDDVQSGWPGFSGRKDAEGNYLVPPMRNRITGEPTIVDSWPFNPFPGTKPKDIEFTKPDGTKGFIGQEIVRLEGAGLDEWPEWLGPQAPAAEYGLKAPDPRAGVRLTPQERDRYAVLFTKEVKDSEGRTYHQALKAMMEDPAYWEASDGTRGTDGGKAGLLQTVDTVFGTLARQALYAETRTAEGQPGSLERQLIEKRGERAIQKIPTKEQPEVRKGFQEQLRELRGLPSTLSR